MLLRDMMIAGPPMTAIADRSNSAIGDVVTQRSRIKGQAMVIRDLCSRYGCADWYGWENVPEVEVAEANMRDRISWEDDMGMVEFVVEVCAYADNACNRTG